MSALNAQPLTADEIDVLRAVRDLAIARGLYSIDVGPFAATLQGDGVLLDPSSSKDDPGGWTFERLAEDVAGLGSLRWCASRETEPTP